MAKSLCHLIMEVNHALVANFNFTNMSFNAIRENIIHVKISEFTAYFSYRLLESPRLVRTSCHTLPSPLRALETTLISHSR